MSLIPALVQGLLKIFSGGPKKTSPGWNRVERLSLFAFG